MEAQKLLAVILGSSVATALVSGIVRIILWKLNRKSAKQDRETTFEKHIKNAVCVILYDRLKHLCRHHIGNGHIMADDLEDIMQMHRVYHEDLDGNGFLDNLMRQVKSLPIRK